MDAPPDPRLTSINPAAFNCDKRFRMITGFTLILDAKNSLVTKYTVAFHRGSCPYP